MAGRLTLVMGGARSGKSAFAQQMASECEGSVVYVATATAGDDEMARRIARHKSQRPAAWRTVEATHNVGTCVASLSPQPNVVLLDCMTLLASNAILALPEPVTSDAADEALSEEVHGILSARESGNAHWIIVSNEVGLGLVPPYPLGRVYRDALGRANQHLAQAASEVLFMVAGLPMRVK